MQFVVRREQLSEFKFVPDAARELEAGAVELSVDRFAFTSNNLTYAVLGDALGYWSFFPTREEGWGTIPVWGFGTVTRSKCDGVAVGERFYGYYPMATHVVMIPGHIHASGFSETAPHRAHLGSVYNRYARTTADPLYRVEHEPLVMLFRPLFGTAFFIDDFLAESGFFGAEAVAFSSASSKTAFSTAFLLSERRKRGATVRIVGLTSRQNLDFVRGLGVYDEIVTYDALDTLRLAPTVFFDMAGSSSVRGAVHRRLKDQLKHSALVGATHWRERELESEPLPGPAPEMFFAPAVIEKRRKELGPQALQERLGAAWTAFVARVESSGETWVRVVEGVGREAIEEVYRAALDNKLNPRDGHVLRFGG